MPKYPLEIEMVKKVVTIVGRWSAQGDLDKGGKIIFIIPKEHHASFRKMKNPLKATFEEIID